MKNIKALTIVGCFFCSIIFSYCKQHHQEKELRHTATLKQKNISCCTGKTPPRFGAAIQPKAFEKLNDTLRSSNTKK